MTTVHLTRRPDDPDWLSRRERLKLWLLGLALTREELVVVCHAMENHAKLVASQRRDYTESERSKALLDGRLITVRKLYYKARLILREATADETDTAASARSGSMVRYTVSIGLMAIGTLCLALSEQASSIKMTDLLTALALLCALVSILVGLWPRYPSHDDDCN